MYQIACVSELHTRYFVFGTSAREMLAKMKKNEYLCSEFHKNNCHYTVTL